MLAARSAVLILLACVVLAGCSSGPSQDVIQKEYDARKAYVKEHPELGD